MVRHHHHPEAIVTAALLAVVIAIASLKSTMDGVCPTVSDPAANASTGQISTTATSNAEWWKVSNSLIDEKNYHCQTNVSFKRNQDVQWTHAHHPPFVCLLMLVKLWYYLSLYGYCTKTHDCAAWVNAASLWLMAQKFNINMWSWSTSQGRRMI